MFDEIFFVLLQRNQKSWLSVDKDAHICQFPPLVAPPLPDTTSLTSHWDSNWDSDWDSDSDKILLCDMKRWVTENEKFVA